MAASHTVENVDFPWSQAKGRREGAQFFLVIAWSLEEPGRIGEVAALAGPVVLGRGEAQPDDGAPRATFVRQRPGEHAATAPLAGSRISRAQLRLRPRGEELEVTSVGRCPLVVRGAVVPSATVREGDTLVLRNAMVLLVVRRPQAMDPRLAYPAADFPFGAVDPHGMVGESPAAWRLRDDLALAARSAHHVLIIGESGVGKELAARAIHALSARAAKTLVARNAATFPEGLVDAELFGTAKSYPHAGSAERPGLIGEADGSTLLLDEIGELPPHLQAHLLRVLDAGGEYQRLGESRLRRADLRLVAATNRDPEALKHDFLARFAARVRVPGLAARAEDVPLLMRHVLDRTAETTPTVRERFFESRPGKAAHARVDPGLVDALLHHPFTHHLREIERLLWLAVSTSRGDFVALTPEVLAELARTTATATTSDDPAAPPPGEEQVRAALAAAAGNVSRAARQLGLKNRFALYRLMKKHGLAVPRDDEAGDV
ncbi:MAG: sigma 54-interacting transcriptional regulator [Byssovorax sp.]